MPDCLPSAREVNVLVKDGILPFLYSDQQSEGAGGPSNLCRKSRPYTPGEDKICGGFPLSVH